MADMDITPELRRVDADIPPPPADCEETSPAEREQRFMVFAVGVEEEDVGKNLGRKQADGRGEQVATLVHVALSLARAVEFVVERQEQSRSWSSFCEGRR